MRKILLIVFCGVLAASLASASFTPCAGTPVSNIGPSTVFTCGALTFDQFQLSPTGGLAGAQLNIGSINTGVNGDEVDLEFQVAGVSSNVGDLLMFYRVTGGVNQIDLHFQAGVSDTGNITIIDTACDVPFALGICQGTQLATITGISNGNPVGISSPFFTTTGTVFMKKDVQYNGDSLSDFVQSQTTPEPMSFLLFGGGLLAVGLLRRRRKA
jgi:hypothetical protein